LGQPAIHRTAAQAPADKPNPVTPQVAASSTPESPSDSIGFHPDPIASAPEPLRIEIPDAASDSGPVVDKGPIVPADEPSPFNSKPSALITPDRAVSEERTIIRPAKASAELPPPIEAPFNESPTLLEPPSSLALPPAPELEIAPEPIELTDEKPTAMHPPRLGSASAPRDNLPGDAAPVPSKSTIIHLPPPAEKKRKAKAPATLPSEVAPATLPTIPGGFSLWAMLFLAIGAGLMWLTLGHPFDRESDWKSAQNAIAARNLLNEGFLPLRGGVYVTAAKDFAQARILDSTQPPLTTWTLAGWIKLFALIEGHNQTSERVLRAFPLACTVLALLLLYGLIKRAFGSGAALTVLILCALMPMTAYYAQVITPAPLCLALILIAAHGYLGFSRTRSRINLVIVVFGLILACLTDWPAYFFAIVLGISHVFQRLQPATSPAAIEPVATPEGEDAEDDEVEGPSRPVLSGILLILVPLAMFVVFFIYLRLNGRPLGDLFAAFSDVDSNGKALSYGEQLGLFKTTFASFWQGKHRFLDPFTIPALLLAIFGLLFWRRWSKRLSTASGELSRRAAGRIVLSLLAAQIIYTLLSPGMAQKQEVWQYTLAAPVAIFAGGFLVWLTVAGWRQGATRRFLPGLFDRAGWATAALIPLAAIGPFAWRMGYPTLRTPARPVEPSLRPAWVAILDKSTDPGDVLLTDLPATTQTIDGKPVLGVNPALPWHADRFILPDGLFGIDTTSDAGLKDILTRYENRRVLYLWFGQNPTPERQKFKTDILDKAYPRFEIPGLIAPPGTGEPNPTVYQLRGQKGTNWKPPNSLSTPVNPLTPLP